jgi:hypothetical protein
MIYPEIDHTPSGIAVIGIGGGAYTNTFVFRTVLKKIGNKYTLKPAGFIRSNGDRSCKTDQGITPINPGDLIVTGSGSLPLDPNNPYAIVNAFLVDEIKDQFLVVSEIPITIADLPAPVITGASIYHNKDGSFFAGGAIS